MFEVKPISKNRTAYEWFVFRDYIDMSPGYQRRGDLWPRKNQALLINSIINGIDIPKIYFADFTFGETPLKRESKLYAVIDGKQRLTSIFRFFDNNLVLDDTPVYYNEDEYNLNGMSFYDIKGKYPHLATIAEKYQLTIMSVFTDDLKYLREMFIRLNQNVSISGPEKRNAMHGPLPSITRDLAVHPFIVYHTRMNTSRGQDLNLTAKFLLMESNHKYNVLGKSTLDRFFRINEDKERVDFLSAINTVSTKLDQMSNLFYEKDPLLTSQNMVLMYYLFLSDAKFPGDSREFLDEFEKNRLLINRLTKDDKIDMQLSDDNTSAYIRFNIAYRSPDNSPSIQAMLKILRDMYIKWCINHSGIKATAHLRN